MKKFLFGVLVFLCLGITVPQPVLAASSPVSRIEFQPLPKPGEKVPIDADHYFIYGFEKPPKIGTATMRVEIFNRDGKRDTSFVVKGDADMPSMMGTHASRYKEFSLSEKGVYLLPFRFVMAGDWEIKFTFVKKGQVIFRGAYQFDI